MRRAARLHASGARVARIAELGDAERARADALEGDGVTDADVPVVVRVSRVGTAGCTLDFDGHVAGGARQRELPARR